jgi:starch synthase
LTPTGEFAMPLLSRSGKPVDVVHIAAELAPFARSGGLGEAVGSLAKSQARAGIPTSIIMPLYRAARSNVPAIEPVDEAFSVQLGSRVERARLFRVPEACTEAGTPSVYFIEHDGYFDRAGLYGENGSDYPDNARRYAFFALAALKSLGRVSNAPRIMHAHDWHTALAPVYLRTVYARVPGSDQTATVLSVHNAGFQGHFPPPTLTDVGLPVALFNLNQIEWYGRVNFLKGGMVFADMVTTVSTTHAHELRTKAGGFGLDGVFVSLRDRFVGIVNGIDQTEWDPSVDPMIFSTYSSDDLTGKRTCRRALQKSAGLQQRTRIPIFAMTARLTSQKGLDLILGNPGYFALDAQYVFLGAGEPRYETALAQIASRAPSRISVQLKFTERLEHRLLAGADLCLMPSQYEPCGLTQMRAQRYGTIPVARRVGGLADTIEDGITGFLFDDYTPEAFLGAVMRAVDHYSDQTAWQAMMREAMGREFGWERSEARYRQAYRKALMLRKI